MKKLVLIISILMVLALTVGLMVSCKKSDDTTTTTTTATTTKTTTSTTTKTTTPTTTTTTTTTPVVTTTTTAAVAPNSPHVDGRTACVVCHKDGIAGAPKFPASPSHASFTDALCVGCHKTTTTSSIPKLPATNHTGLTMCLACHTTGLGGAPKVLASHANYSDTNPAAAVLCLACHKS